MVRAGEASGALRRHLRTPLPIFERSRDDLRNYIHLFDDLPGPPGRRVGPQRSIVLLLTFVVAGVFASIFSDSP